MEQLKPLELDLRNIEYRERAAHKEVEAEPKVQTLTLINEVELRIAGETHLLMCMQSLKKPNEDNEAPRKSLKELQDVAETCSCLR